MLDAATIVSRRQQMGAGAMGSGLCIYCGLMAVDVLWWW